MNGWAQQAIDKLTSGEAATVRPRGNSMTPLIHSGDLVEIEPVGEGDKLRKGDIVLARVNGRVYLHKVSALEGQRVQISNNHGHVNGWTKRSNVFGRRAA